MKKIFALIVIFSLMLSGASHQILIPEFATAPKLDGEDSDACWQNAAVIFGLVDNQTQTPMREATVLRLVRHGETLYGFVFCEQKGAEALASKKGPSNNLGSVELFFTNDTSIIQFILNYRNSIFQQELLPESILGTRRGQPLTSGIQVHSSIQSDSWTVEFAIPLKSLQLKGKDFGLNLVRNNRIAQETGVWMLVRNPRFKQWAAQYQDFPRAAFTEKYDGLFTVSGSKVTAARDLENAVMQEGQRETLQAGTTLTIDPEKPFCLNLIQAGQCVYRYAYTVPEKVTLILGDHEIAWPVLHFSPFMPCQVLWQTNHSFPVAEKEQGHGRVFNKFEIVFDVPEGIEVLNGVLQPQTVPGRNTYIQKLSKLNRVKFRNNVETLFGCTLKPGTKDILRYQVRWPEGQTEVHELPIASVDVRGARQPEKVIVGFYGTRDAWLENLRQIGLNLMCIPYHTHDDKTLAEIQRHRKDGFKVAYSSTQDIPFGSGRLFSTWLENDPSTRTLDINGRYLIGPKNGKYQLSPSYRGKLFQDGLAATREYCQKAGFQYYIFDTEDYFQSAGNLGDFSERTLQWFERWFKEKHAEKEYLSPLRFERAPEAYPDYHHAWNDFKCEIWADFFQEIKKGMNTTGDAVFIDYGMRSVDEETCQKRLTDYHWLKVFDGGIGGGWYSGVDRSVRSWIKVYDEMRDKWNIDPVKAIWISPARLLANFSATNAPPVRDEMKCKFFEGMTLGARSYIIFKQIYIDMDSVRQLAEAIQVLSQCEDVVYHGKRIENLTTDVPYWEELSDYFSLRQYTTWKNQPRVLVKGLEHEGKALISVSEYREQIPRDVTVFYAFSKDSTVRDLETGETVASPRAGEKSFSVKLDADHCCRIFLIESAQK